MSDYIGRIPVPVLADSGLTFPFASDMGFGVSRARPIVTHAFGSGDTKIEQRFAVGVGPRKFQFRRALLNLRDRNTLKAFWEGLVAATVPGTEGPWASFTYSVPNPDRTTTPTKVTFENGPVTLQYLQNGCQVGLTFVEVIDPAAAPTYSVTATNTRFPDSTLEPALQSQVQQIIPLLHIRVREAAVANIYLSDRRCTVGGQLYQARVLNLGEPGSDVIISQDIKGTADNVQFSFGNADRVMTALANDTDLKFATVELSLYHVNTGILLNLWSGCLISFLSDGTAKFVVQASDGFYQVTQQYPPRVISRCCWKPFKDGNLCPYAGASTSCDYYFDSVNGCQAHGMQLHFGGHPANPQGINIKDNSTGTWGIGRNTVTATSIVSDTVFGKALQEVWCNWDGDPGRSISFIHYFLVIYALKFARAFLYSPVDVFFGHIDDTVGQDEPQLDLRVSAEELNGNR